jgi:hypothetical protein
MLWCSRAFRCESDSFRLTLYDFTQIKKQLLPDETPETLQTQISMIHQEIDQLERKREGLEERLSLIWK